jgi:hypothetical protein
LEARYNWNVIEALRRQLLEWLDREPRTYGEAMEAWRTSCPRLSIWEDAQADGLIEVEGGSVRLTERGRQTLRALSVSAEVR